mgnify:CR=1 FL=1
MKEVAEIKKEADEQRGEGSRMPSLLSEVESERDAIYAALAKKPEPPPEPEERPEEKAEEKVEEKAEFVPEDKPQDEEKTVPYGALKEEREKRKELARRVKELEEAFKQAAEDNKRLAERASAQSEEEPITDYEKELISLRKENRAMRDELKALKASIDRDRQAASEVQIKTLVERTGDELAKEGFEGFQDFIPQVVQAMRAEGIEAAEETPEIWKRVYKEQVWPKYVGKYRPSKKAEKEELKKKASLIKSPGKTEPPKKEEEWTPKTYAQWRQSQSFV